MAVDITAGGVLTVKSAANIDGSASATGTAVTNATSFDPSAVDTSNSTINRRFHSTLKTGDAVTYYPGQGGAAIGGLTAGTTYYVNVVSDGVIKLYEQRGRRQCRRRHRPDDPDKHRQFRAVP